MITNLIWRWYGPIVRRRVLAEFAERPSWRPIDLASRRGLYSWSVRRATADLEAADLVARHPLEECSFLGRSFQLTSMGQTLVQKY